MNGSCAGYLKMTVGGSEKAAERTSVMVPAEYVSEIRLRVLPKSSSELLE